MSYKIFTTGLRFYENKNSTINIDPHYRLFECENIKVVVDTRSITSYIKYDEKSSYNPINLHKNLKERNIEYYNVGDLFRLLGLNLKNKDRHSMQEVKTKFYGEFSELLDNLGTKFGNICVLFQTVYCYANNRRNLTWRGSYSKHMRNNSLDGNIKHFVAFKSGRTIFDNTELWNEAYGELTTIKRDIEDRKRPRYEYYDDDYNSHDDGYSSQDLEDMYRDAFDGNPEAQWNID